MAPEEHMGDAGDAPRTHTPPPQPALEPPAGQDAGLHLADLHAALMRLPPERREALLLVGAGGFSYEEAAAICDCAVGTIKSRVARARAALGVMMNDESPAQTPAPRVSSAQEAIMAELNALTRGPCHTKSR